VEPAAASSSPRVGAPDAGAPATHERLLRQTLVFGAIALAGGLFGVVTAPSWVSILGGLAAAAGLAGAFAALFNARRLRATAEREAAAAEADSD